MSENKDRELIKKQLLGLVSALSGKKREQAVELVEVLAEPIGRVTIETAPARARELGDLITKEGYVWKYWVHLEMDPNTIHVENIPDAETYFKVIISSKVDSEENPVEFKLRRDYHSSYVDIDQSSSDDKEPWAIRWSSVSMAIIATLKDAFFSKQKVKVEGIFKRHSDRVASLAEKFEYNELITVEIMQ